MGDDRVHRVPVDFNQQQLMLLDRLAEARGAGRAEVIEAVFEEYRRQHPELLGAVEGSR